MSKWLAAFCFLLSAAGVWGQTTNPSDWVDADTGHRVIRLSTEPGSRTFYFHDYSYTPEGDKLVFNTPDGVAVVDITKFQDGPPTLKVLAQGMAIMARHSRELYVQTGGGRGGGRRGGAATQPDANAATTQPARGDGFGGGRGGGPVYAVNIDTGARRLIPNAVNQYINSDETLDVIGAPGATDPTGKTPRPASRPYVSQLNRMFPGKTMDQLTQNQQYAVRKEDNLARRTLDPSPAAWTFVDLKTGERKTTAYQYGSLDHQQWSPTNPDLLLYAHEGTWHEVDRTWVTNARTGETKLMHKRSMDMEINGHEWWSYDGQTVWYDLQMPRSQDFWIGGTDLKTMKETHYHITRDSWGIHFNSSRDNTMFADDGGDPTQVAFSDDGMWINVFFVQPDGSLKREKLVNMSKHNYVTGQQGIEPNVSITPDKKWVIFTGNSFDGNQVYAVEIAKSK